MTALIFNCHYNGLSILQELGRRGVPVFGLDDVRSIGTFSRYAHYLKCPNPMVAEDHFIDYLLQIASKFEDKPVLFPTNDHWAVAISKHKELLSTLYTPCVTDYSSMNLVIHKSNFYRWAQERGYPVPYSYYNLMSSESISDNLFPLVAKPNFRRISANDPMGCKQAEAFDKLRVTLLHTREEFLNYCENNYHLLDHILFQEYVKGLSNSMYTIGIYADKNYEVRALFTGRKVRGFPPDNGDCILGQVENVPDKIKQIVINICKEIKYHGIAEFEFKKDIISGQYKLIEINPRSWSWIGITPFCNVSLAWIAYSDLNGFPIPNYVESNMPDGSIKYIKILQDIRNCFWLNKSFGYPEWHISFKQWKDTLKADKVIYAELSKDDIFPALYAVFQTFLAMINNTFKN